MDNKTRNLLNIALVEYNQVRNFLDGTYACIRNAKYNLADPSMNQYYYDYRQTIIRCRNILPEFEAKARGLKYRIRNLQRGYR